MSTPTITVGRTQAIVGTTVAVVVLVVLVQTVLRRGWWAKRIDAKWSDLVRIPQPDPTLSSSGWEYAHRHTNLETWTLAELVRAYFKGGDGWVLRADIPDPNNTTPTA